MAEYRTRRPVANTYLVRERDRRRARELALVLVVLVALGGALLASSWIQLQALATGYRIVDLERRLRELERVERALDLEAAYLASPERIDRRAREELGLVPAAPGQIVFLEPR